MCKVFIIGFLSLFLLSCRRTELIEVQSAFERPIVVNDVEFLVEKDPQLEEGSVVLDPLKGIIYAGGQPLVRKLRYSIFEIEGKRYHFARGSKIFIFLPKPEGSLKILFKDLVVLLVGPREESFVVRYSRNGVEKIRYGISEISFDGETYLINNKKTLDRTDAKRYIVKVSRSGRFSVLEKTEDKGKRRVLETD